MRLHIHIAALSALTLLSGCVFESAAPLIPPAEYATPLASGAYIMSQREDSGAWTTDSNNTLTESHKVYTITNAEGPMNFTLYRVSPSIFIAQLSDNPDEAAYGLLELTPNGATVTHLPCKALSMEERTRFHLAPSPDSNCVFTSLDDLVTAALYLKGRGETPSIKLEKR